MLCHREVSACLHYCCGLRKRKLRPCMQMGQAAQQGAEGFWAMASWMQDRMHAQRGQQPAP